MELSQSQSNLRLVKDHIYPERFFSYHSEGAHLIHAVYLEGFRRLFDGVAGAHTEDLPVVCRSNVCCLVSAVPLDPAIATTNAVVGFLILHVILRLPGCCSLQFAWRASMMLVVVYIASDGTKSRRSPES